MNKIISVLKLEGTTKHSTVVSATQTAGPDTSPHPLLITAGSNLVTEAVKVCRQEKETRRFVEVKATLVPRLGYNIVTSAMVKWLGLEDDIEDLEPSDSSTIIADDAALRAIGCIELGVIFHKAGNLTRTWAETFFVVEQLWADMELMLGGTMCENAKITVGDRALPTTIKKTSEEVQKQEEENAKEAQKEAEATMAAEARELLEESAREAQKEAEARMAAEARELLEENAREAQRQAQATMAAEARESLSTGDKKPEGAAGQSK